ncbi:MAG: hypothetical protein JWN88_167 [Frankiales bacterium]|nr:hypothetical protein [Frankiales bacterium]
MTTTLEQPTTSAAGSVWRTAGLPTLFAASTTARLANEAARVAMVLLVLDRTGSPALAGAVVGALTLPALLTGPLLGAWLDRTPHRRQVFVANQLLLLGALVGLLAATGHAPSYVVVLLGLVAGLTAPVLTGGFTGLIPPLVPAPLLRRAYGAEATSYNVAGVAGPALAGALAAVAGADVAVGVTAALSLVALLAVLRVHMPLPVADPARAGLVRTVATGLRLLARVPALRAITVATTVSFTGLGALPVVLPLLAVELGQDPAAGGAFFSAFALGALGGSVAVASRAPRTGPMRLAFLGIAGLGLAFAAVAVAPTFPVALVLVVLAGALEGPVLASTLAVRATHSPADMQTQVVMTAASLKFGGFAAGSALAGLVVAGHGVRAGLLVLALLQGVALVAGLLARGTRRRPG